MWHDVCSLDFLILVLSILRTVFSLTVSRGGIESEIDPHVYVDGAERQRERRERREREREEKRRCCFTCVLLLPASQSQHAWTTSAGGVAFVGVTVLIPHLSVGRKAWRASRAT